MITIEIRTENAAFENKGAEIARLLRRAAELAESGVYDCILMDCNGNRVGTMDEE